MARRHLAVALLPPPEISAAIDGLRGAVGDPNLRRIPPHITLVPPVNVAVDAFDDALAIAGDASRRVGPFGLRVGPPTTFLPATPVLYLAVAGELDALFTLRTAVYTGLWERPLEWPFVPHVTLHDRATPERIDAAIVALADATFDFHVREIHVLEEFAGRVWRPIASFPLRTRYS